MPRYARIVIPGCAHHLTQRGNHREPAFGSDEDPETYLDLLAEQARYGPVSILGHTLMPNHAHWIATPHEERGLAAVFGRAHHRYSHYLQAKSGTSGRLWQHRFYICPSGRDHLVRAMRYVEMNAVRAGMAPAAFQYPWSSAQARVSGRDPRGMLDLDTWRAECRPEEWRELLEAGGPDGAEEHERCTDAGKPYGGEEFRRMAGLLAGRDLALRVPGRPKGAAA